jgi:hypothetical protein
MTDVYSDEYWQNEFKITQNDLARIAERMSREKKAQDLKAIAVRIIHGRLEHGHDLSPVALTNLTGEPSVRLWDPEANWQLGDLVLVARENPYNHQYDAFLGIISSTNPETAYIYIEELKQKVGYGRLLPGTSTTLRYGTKADTWRSTVKDAVERKLQSQDINVQAEGILLRYGENILNRLHMGLAADAQFIGLEGQWYLVDELQEVDAKRLEILHNQYVGLGSFLLEDALKLFEVSNLADTIILKMSIHVALVKQPERFKNSGTLLRSLWNALPPKPDKARVKYYAYDPQTYEILCAPEQRLASERAKRLIELGLYNCLVTFSEGAYS